MNVPRTALIALSFLSTATARMAVMPSMAWAAFGQASPRVEHEAIPGGMVPATSGPAARVAREVRRVLAGPGHDPEAWRALSESLPDLAVAGAADVASTLAAARLAHAVGERGTIPSVPALPGAAASPSSPIVRLGGLRIPLRAALHRVACKVLEGVFTEVLEASSAREALEIVRAHPREITLLLTDVVMPGMGGRALSEQMRARSPGTSVLFMSAYTDDEVVLEGIRQANLEFIPKPFSVDGLRDKVLEVLGKRASPRGSGPTSADA